MGQFIPSNLAWPWKGWLGADAEAKDGVSLRVKACVRSVVCVAICTLVDYLVFGKVAEPTLIMVYFVGVVAIATRGSLVAALLCAALSIAAFDFFFTPPYFTLAVLDARYYTTFMTMAFLGVLISVLVSRMVDDLVLLARAEAGLAVEARELSVANRALREADRYKDEFLAAISHELRTPLTTVLGFAAMLAEGDAGPLSESQAAFLSKVLEGADQLNEVIKNLVELSKMQAGKFRLSCSPTAYEPVLNQAVSDLRAKASAKGVDLTVEADVPGEVLVDGERVALVISNLVDNAIKYSAPGGTIRIRAFVEGECLVTEVQDSGPGMPPEVLPTLFRRFHQLDMSNTRSVGGLGIGLAVCKAIVEAHDGRIGVRSEVGRGSTFRFSLPMRRLE